MNLAQDPGTTAPRWASIPGPIDGIVGRLTRGAVRRFQAAKGLEVDGQVGPITWGALFPPETREDDLPWMDVAWGYLGLREWRQGSNPMIMAMAETLDLDHYTDDNIPWCGLYVGYAVGAGLPDEPLPENILGARQWLKFGQPISSPAEGAVAVFWRGRRSGWQGHVGFVVGNDRTHLSILGGNQSNEVNVRRISKDRLLGLRWAETSYTKPDFNLGGYRARETDGDEA